MQSSASRVRSLVNVSCITLVFISLFMLLSLVILSARNGSSTQISFPHFSPTDNIIAFGDARFHPTNHSFIINPTTPDRANTTGTCGELLYGNQVRIQDVSSGKVASFSTSFSFRFTTPVNSAAWDNNNSSTGGSLFAFVFLHSEGIAMSMDLVSWLGRSSACHWCHDIHYPNGLSAMPTIGVVFDTDYDNNSKPIARPQGDPSNNFIVVTSSGRQKEEWENELNSTYEHNLCGNQTHCDYLTNGGPFTAWVDFDHEHNLEVRLANGSQPHVVKPVRPLIQIPEFYIPKDLGDNVYLTFWGSSAENHVEVHELLSWSFVSSGLELERTSKVIALVVGVIGTVLAAAGFIYCSSSGIAKPFRKHCNFGLCGFSGSRAFSYRELRKATKNFSQEQLLGKGASGAVYRGCLDSPPGSLIAVKHITYESKNAEATFLAEISSLGQIRHRNVVRLHGWCEEEGRLLLVYDYMPNGSLNEWLHEKGTKQQPRTRKVLTWKQRHHILAGVAAALEYMHEDGVQCILHRDIKSSNVLLDSDFNARLGDFGLARLLDHQKVEKTTMAAGTFGYMAPEMPYTGKATKESDVYSFGILVLEVVCGRRPLNMRAQEPEDIVLLQILWRAHEAGALLTMADPRLPVQHGQPSDWTRMVVNLLHLGLLCCLPNPKARLSMGDVSRILLQIGVNGESDVAMPPLPITKPFGLYSCLEYSQTGGVRTWT